MHTTSGDMNATAETGATNMPCPLSSEPIPLSFGWGAVRPSIFHLHISKKGVSAHNRRNYVKWVPTHTAYQLTH